jgi:integrase
MTSRRVPSYRLKQVRTKSGLKKYAIVSLPDGRGARRDFLLGDYGSPQSHEEYQRKLAEWTAHGRRLPEVNYSDITVAELIVRFLAHAQEHYRRPDGTQTGEVSDYKRSLKPVRELYAHALVREFKPSHLKAVRQRMLDQDWCRTTVNQRVSRVVHLFRWAVSEELVAETVYAALRTVPGLERGRSGARESEPVRPVPDQFVDAVLPFVLAPVRAMIQLQRLSGMRPGEVVSLRAADLDMGGPVWIFKPRTHKMSYRGKERTICLGPKAQAVVKPFLTLNVEDFLFSPRRATGQQRYRDRYTRDAYTMAIRRGCVRAGVPHWHPNQLRHNHGTVVRKQFGIECAQTVLGHSKMSTTEIYAEKNLNLASQVASAIG